MLKIFKEKFGDLTITRGNSHDFIGIDLTITKDKRVDIAARKNRGSNLNVRRRD